MKPEGIHTLQGTGAWKKDHQIHRKNRKIGNWWEDICNISKRSRLKQLQQKEIEEEIEELNTK